MNTRLSSMIIKSLNTAYRLLIILSILTGIVYPLVVTGLAQLIFPWQANGSIIYQNGQPIGSALIGQFFNDPKYFWGRPSMTSPFPYNSANSSGSNLAISNPEFLAMIKSRVNYLRQTSNMDASILVPIGLVTASGSGLDPELSLSGAWYQVSRVAKARDMPENELQSLINHLIKKPTWGFLGETRINVLELNLALDKLRSTND